MPTRTTLGRVEFSVRREALEAYLSQLEAKIQEIIQCALKQFDAGYDSDKVSNDINLEGEWKALRAIEGDWFDRTIVTSFRYSYIFLVVSFFESCLLEYQKRNKNEFDKIKKRKKSFGLTDLVKWFSKREKLDAKLVNSLLDLVFVRNCITHCDGELWKVRENGEKREKRLSKLTSMGAGLARRGSRSDWRLYVETAYCEKALKDVTEAIQRVL